MDAITLKKSLAIILGFLSFAFLSDAHAAEVWHSSKIRLIYPLANGSVVLAMATNAADCTNTSSPKYHFIQAGQNGMTAEGVKNLLAVAMAAAAQGKDVSISYDNATNSCFVNRLSVSY